MSDLPKIGVMIAIPMKHWHGPNTLHPWMQTELERLPALAPGYQFQVAVIEGGLVRARNKLVAAFLKSDCRWLLWWDDDIQAKAEDVLRLLAHKMPVVGALYCTRSERSHYVANFMHEVTVQRETLLQVVELGTGFKLYHREVFDRLAEAYPQSEYTDRDSGERIFAFFQNMVLQTDIQPDGDLLSEDYFCDHLCRHNGIGILADISMKLDHRGPDGKLYPDKWPEIPGVPS